MPISKLDEVLESRLTWPADKPRAARRVQSLFRTEVSVAKREIEEELARWGIKRFIVSANNQRIYAGDPGCAVWWEDKKGELRVFACDKWQKLADNLHAIYLTLEALRALGRWGAYTAEQAAEGAKAKALPPPDGTDWKKILGYISPPIPKQAQLVLCEHAYRSMARENAGDEAKLRMLNIAIESARKELAS